MKNIEKTSSLVAKGLNQTDPFLIGLAGYPGAGKTTLAKELIEELKNKSVHVALINGESYIKYARAEKMKLVENMKKPEEYWKIFDIAALKEDLQKIKGGLPVHREGVNSRETGQLDGRLDIDLVPKNNVVIADSHMTCHPEIVNLFDQIILVDASPEECLSRKIKRATYRSEEETKKLFDEFEKPTIDMHKDALKNKVCVITISN